MILGNYVINAEQAREITNNALEHQGMHIKRIELEQAEEELNDIYKLISQAASRGRSFAVVWIMYNSTYANLIEHGFKLSGGVIRENIPKNKWASFGQGDDVFLIEWGEENAK